MQSPIFWVNIILQVLTVLNDSPKYLPGYWRGEAAIQPFVFQSTASVAYSILHHRTCRSSKLLNRCPIQATACAVDGYVCEGLLKPHMRAKLKAQMISGCRSGWFLGPSFPNLAEKSCFDGEESYVLPCCTWPGDCGQVHWLISRGYPFFSREKK